MHANGTVILVVFAVVLAAGAVTAEATVALDWTVIGDPGNFANSDGYGSVGYRYEISDYETTNDQYCEFLNAVVPVVGDTYGLYNTDMENDSLGGINVDTGGGYGNMFSVKTGMGDRPVNFVSWYDGIRFANWLTNGQPAGTDPNYTETGSYTITSGGFNSGTVSIPSSVQRAAWADANDLHVLLPSEDEWYKAAYYKGGGRESGYNLYPTQSDTIPTGEAPTSTATNSAMYTPGIADPGYVYSPTGPCDVGSYASTESAYETHDLAGNVWEWDESIDVPNDTAIIRGGGWSEDSSYGLPNTSRIFLDADDDGEQDNIGFRLSLVEHPTPDIPVVTAVETITTTATQSSIQPNNNLMMSTKVVRTSDDVFAVIIPEDASPQLEQTWQLVKRNGGDWDVVASGQQGRPSQYLWVSPDETIHTLAFPNDINPDGEHHITMWSGKWDANTESITMVSQEVPDMANDPSYPYPRLMAGGNTEGYLAVSTTKWDPLTDTEAVHYYAIYDADSNTWTTNTLTKDCMYTYNWFFPHEDGEGVTYVNSRAGANSEFGYTSPPDSNDWGGQPPHYDFSFNQVRLWQTDDLSTTAPETIYSQTLEPNTAEFAYNFAHDVYQDHVGRIFVISSRIGGGWGTATDEVQDFHYWLKVLSHDGRVLDDIQLPDPERYDWDTADSYKMFQDATGQFWLLSGHDATLRCAGDDGVTIGDPIQLSFGELEQLWWNISIANSRSGNELSNTIDLTFAGVPDPYDWPGDNLSETYYYASIEIPEVLDGDADRDGDVDNVDFGMLYGAFTGPNPLEGTDNADRADLIYYPATGKVELDPNEAAGGMITSYALENLLGLLEYGDANLYDFDANSTDYATAYQISQTCHDMDEGIEAKWDLSDIFPTGMSLTELTDFLDLGKYCGTPGTGYYDFDVLCRFDGYGGWSNGDFDLDGDVDNVDFGTLFGALTGPAAVGTNPEPATVMLLMIGSVAIMRRRRE